MKANYKKFPRFANTEYNWKFHQISKLLKEGFIYGDIFFLRILHQRQSLRGFELFGHRYVSTCARSFHLNK